jgi:hypothetical protein
LQRLHICAANVTAVTTSGQQRQQQQPVSAQSEFSASNCLQMPRRVLPGMCLDGGDALMFVAAGAGSVGVVALLLQQGIGEQACRPCT